MLFWCDLKFEKGEKMFAKSGFEPGSIASKSIQHMLYHVRHCSQCCQLSDFIAIFNNFSDPPSDFFPKKRVATNLETSWTNFSESLWSLVLPQQREISAHATLSLHLLCSMSVWEEQPVRLKEILCCFSNFTCKYSQSHNTGIVFVLSYIVCIIWFHQMTAQ